jgi:hypothetical protein
VEEQVGASDCGDDVAGGSAEEEEMDVDDEIAAEPDES